MRITKLCFAMGLISMLLVGMSLDAQTAYSFPSGATDYGVGRSPIAGAVADFNLDGYNDLVVANSGSSSLSVLRSTGPSGTAFSPAVTIPVCRGTAPNAVIAASLNPKSTLYGNGSALYGSAPSTYTAYDDYPDLVVSCPRIDSVEILLNDTTGGFPHGTFVTVGKDPVALLAGNFSGSGNEDLAVVNQGSGTVSILDGDGMGNFTLALTTNTIRDSALSSITDGDYNADNLLDFAVTDSADGGRVYVYLATSPGTYGTPASYKAGPGATSIQTADFNKDSNLDLAVADTIDNRITLLLGSPNGTFTTQSPMDAGTARGMGMADHEDQGDHGGWGDGQAGNLRQIIALDVNGDDATDLLAVSSGGWNQPAVLTQLLNQGSGSFAPAQRTAMIENGRRISDAIMVTSDLNLDGMPDLVAIQPWTNQVSSWLNNTPMDKAAFSWDRVPMAADVDKLYSPFSSAEAQFIATHLSMIVTDNPPNYEANDTGCGSLTDIELGFCEASHAIKSYNPNVKTLFYWNTDVYYPRYQATPTDPNWTTPPYPTPGADAHRHPYTYVNGCDPAFQSWWATSAASTVTVAGADGIFADHGKQPCVPQMLQAYAQVQAQQGLQSPLVIYNGIATEPQFLAKSGGVATYPFITGGMNETYGLPNAQQGTNATESAEQNVLSVMLTADRAGAVTIFKGWPGFSQYDKPSFITVNPYGLLMSRSRQNITFALASYLVTAHRHSYLDFSWAYKEDNCGEAGFISYTYDPASGVVSGGTDCGALTPRVHTIDPSWYPELLKPLGPPLEEPHISADGSVYTRRFLHASVTVNLQNNMGSIIWF